MLFMETSAKTGMNIEKTFVSLGEEIYSKVKEGIIDLSNDVFLNIFHFLLTKEFWCKSWIIII